VIAKLGRTDTTAVRRWSQPRSRMPDSTSYVCRYFSNRSAWRQPCAYGADIVGVSSLSGGHRELVEGLLDELASLRAGIPVVLGGIFPAADARHLKAKGVAASFGPGTPLDAIVEALCACIERARCVHPADHVG
jgi:hypothetical protein